MCTCVMLSIWLLCWLLLVVFCLFLWWFLPINWQYSSTGSISGNRKYITFYSHKHAIVVRLSSDRFAKSCCLNKLFLNCSNLKWPCWSNQATQFGSDLSVKCEQWTVPWSNTTWQQQLLKHSLMHYTNTITPVLNFANRKLCFLVHWAQCWRAFICLHAAWRQ